MAEDVNYDFSGTESDSSDQEDTAMLYKKRNAIKFAVSEEIETVSATGIATTIQRLNLKYATEDGGFLGNKVLTQNSKKAYEKHFKGIQYCFVIILTVSQV